MIDFTCLINLNQIEFAMVTFDHQRLSSIKHYFIIRWKSQKVNLKMRFFTAEMCVHQEFLDEIYKLYAKLLHNRFKLCTLL